MKTMISVGTGLAILLACAQYGEAASLYNITDLGTLGGVNSEAYALNDSGQVVGWAENAAGDQRAFLYSGGTISDLGVLGGTESIAYDINNSGQVVGQSNLAAFLYSGSGPMQGLGTLGGSSSAALGINDSGIIVGESENAGGYYRAFQYAGSGPMTDLGTLDGGYSVAYDVNTGGVIAGDSDLHAFSYYGGSMQDLGTLGVEYSFANAVNDFGVVVGESDSRAFIYEPGSPMRDLGAFNDSYSIAFGINNSGLIVGESDYTGFIYDPSVGAIADLNDMISGTSPWTVFSAQDINESGQIAAIGYDASGNTHALLLDPMQQAAMVWSNGGGDQDWFNAANWAPNGTPAADSEIIVSSGSPVAASDVTVDGGGSITVDGPTAAPAFTNLLIGPTSAGRLNLRNQPSMTVSQWVVVGETGTIDVGPGNATITSGVANGGSINVQDGSTLTLDGLVVGTGNFTGTGTVEFESELSPGASLGTISIAGDVLLAAGSVLINEVSGTGTDRLEIAGDLTIDNAGLKLDWLPGDETSKFGGTYTIATYGGTLNGTFDTTDLLGNIGERYLAGVDYSDGEINVTLYNLGDGDINLDGFVDVGDLSALSEGWDPGGANQNSWLTGDLDFSGFVDIGDLTELSNGWAPGGVVLTNLSGDITPASIPEPGSAMMVMLAAAGLLLCRRRSRR